MRNITAVKSRAYTRFKMLKEGWGPEDSIDFLEPLADEIDGLADSDDFDGEIILNTDSEDPYIEIAGDDIEAERIAKQAAQNVYGADTVIDLYLADENPGILAFVSFDGLLGVAPMN